MDKAPFGIVSLESAFSLLYSRLVKSGVFTLQQLVYWMSEAPAKRFGMQRKGVLKEGYASDMILVDLDEEYTSTGIGSCQKEKIRRFTDGVYKEE